MLSFHKFIAEIREIMDHIPSGVLIALDSDGTSILANRSARELFGLALTGEISASLPGFRASLTGHEVLPAALPLQRSMRHDRLIHAEDYEVLRSDGMRRFVTMSAAPLYGQAGEVRGGVAILVDVTYLRTQERHLRFESHELNRLIAREQRVTDILQNAQLPLKLPEVDGFALSALYRSSDSERSVGGDWYDAFHLPDGRIGLSIGDVMGSGIAAAITMAKVRQAIQSAALVRPDPPTMLDAANSTLTLHDARAAATAVAGVLNPVTAELTFASAGHPLPLVRQNAGELGEFTGIAPPLGVFEKARAQTHCATLLPGDLAVFYTDGLIDSGHDGISGDRLLRSILSSTTFSAVDEIAESLHRRMRDTGSRTDDVAILTVARSGLAPGRTL
jgi:PAS domain S-box-containing protein